MAQGITGAAGGRPEPQPVIRLFSFLADKADVPAEGEIGGRKTAIGAGAVDAAGAGKEGLGPQTRSTASAMPCPPPMHMVTRP